MRDGEIYARGAADDKGQIFMHFKALEAHMKQNGRLPVNMKVLLEGEEEVGSVNLDDFIQRRTRTLLAADVVVISDSPMFERGVPSICYGLRGLAYYQIDCAARRAICTRASFGGAVANPAFVLAQMLAQMKDESGRIKIPGFYDDVRELTRGRAGGVHETAVRREEVSQGDRARRSCLARAATPTLERVWARPTFEVNGLLSGFTGEGRRP